MRTRSPLVLLAGIAVAVLWGCNSNSAGTLPDADFFVNEGQGFPLRVGETAGVQTISVVSIVRFTGVVNDSRCPENAQCEDAGFATVALSVQSALAVTDVELQVPPGGGAEMVVEELTVEVLELRPDAQEGVTIDLLDYVVVLRVRQTSDLGVT